jgi:hypothetical protein
LDSAKRAVELGEHREKLIECANAIGAAYKIYFGAEEPRPIPLPSAAWRLEVKMCIDEFKALMIRELKAQLAEIDEEMREHGVEPEPFEA